MLNQNKDMTAITQPVRYRYRGIIRIYIVESCKYFNYHVIIQWWVALRLNDKVYN